MKSAAKEDSSEILRFGVRALSLTLAMLAVNAWGQTTTGSILGRVTDRTGAVLPGVTLVVRNEGTGLERTLVSDREGRYEAATLPPAAYRIEATLTGFRRAVRSGIHLRVNESAVVDVALEVGDLKETLFVEGDAPLVETQNATLGTVVDNHKVLELPLNGRDFFQLATIVAGAVPPAEGSQNSTQGGAVSVNGAREQSNNFLLDGVDNNDLGINQIVVRPGIDMVQEVKIQTGGYSAEFGRSGGGQFSYVTKSGANAWHGSAYEFLRNAVFDARNFFDDPQRDIPRFDRNEFGATLGGPLKRDRLFVFAGYEGTRVHQAFTRVATVPPLAWRRGDLSSWPEPIVDPLTGQPFPGNVIPPSRIDPAGAAILGFYPPPDDSGALGPSGATVAPVGSNHIDQFTVRVDYVAGPSSQLFARYSLWNEDRFNPFDPLVDLTNVPGFGSFTRNLGQSLAVGWTRTLGGRGVNELRFGFNHLRAGIFQEHQGEDVSSALGIRGLATDPNDVGRPGVILGLTDALTEPTNTPQERRDSTFQVVDSLTWLVGRHGLRVGAELRHFRLNSYLDILARGQFIFVGSSGNPIADLLLGTPALALRMNPEKGTDMEFRTTSLGAYVQDAWKVTDDLTLNLGLRYEYNQPPYETQDRLSVPNFDSATGDFIRVGTQGIPRAGFIAETSHLAPRIGFAWKPFHDSKTALRGGYGIFYDLGILNYNLSARYNPPFFALDLVSGPLLLRDAFSGTAEAITFVEAPDLHYKEPCYRQWHLEVQRELSPAVALELGYFGSQGRHLLLSLDPNQGAPGGPPLRNPAFGPAEGQTTSGSSDYHAFQARVERRAVGGLSLLGSYTWSRSRDDSSALFGSRASNYIAQNSSNLAAERGPSDFDTPHRFVFSFIWELPFGKARKHLNGGGVLAALFGDWELTGIVAVQSGRPFTVYYGAAANYSGTDNGANGGLGFDRPNLTGNPTLANPDPSRWFDTTAFTTPENTFGNVGRNTLRGDGSKTVDLGLYRKVTLARSAWLQFRVEAFNVFNHPNFLLPVGDLTSASAGRVVRARDSRQIQFAVKVGF